MALLDVAAGRVRIARQIVDVQLDRGRTGVLDRAGVVDPTRRGDPVQARDDRDVDRLGRAPHEAQVPAGGLRVLGFGRQV